MKRMNLPRTEHGFDVEAIWASPQYAEAIRQRDAIRAQLAARCYAIVAERRPTDQELELQKHRERKRIRAARRKGHHAAAASVI
jgi:hypothetical protein